MTVVSSKEFVANEDKYFELAEHEDVCIKRGNGMFHLLYRPMEIHYPEQPILEPDDDLRNAITKEECKVKVHKVIHNFFVNQ